MKAQELRVGNLIHSLETGKTQVITGINEECVSINTITWDYVSYEEIEHIPLTEELFKHLNPEFRFLRDFSAFYVLKGILFEINGYGLKEAKIFCNIYHIKYLHQLQNVIHALTGEELTYENN